MRKIQHKSGSTATYIDGAYQTDDGYVIPDWAINPKDWQEITKDYEILKWTDVFPRDKEYRKEIISVQRFSDGEVFSVGDQVSEGSLRGEIYKFEENKGVLWVWFAGCGSLLCNIQKSKRNPIRTTEDGVELFEGDSAWLVGKVHSNYIGETIIESGTKLYSALYFSTPEAAEEYRLNNYRGLSVKDISVNDPGLLKTTADKLRNLIKSRLL